MSEVNLKAHEHDFSGVAITERYVGGYNTTVLLGDRRRTDELGVCGGVFPVVIDYLLENMNISGSAISEAAKGKSSEDRDHLLPEAIDVFDGLVNAYYAGEMQPKDMSAEAYMCLHVILGTQGPNIDINGWSKSENTQQTVERMKNLLWFGFSNFYDGAQRTISKINYHGRHSYIHMVDSFMTGNGGINFLIFPKDHDDSNWSTMNSLRRDQRADLRLSEDGGHWVLLNDLNPDRVYRLELSGKTDTSGKWVHHGARAIRTATNSSLNIDFDADSVANKRPWDKEVGFEDVVGTISNLMTAFFAKPMETVEMIEKVGLNEELPGWNGDLAKETARRILRFKKTAADAIEHNKVNHFDFRELYPETLYECLGLEDVDDQGWIGFLGKLDEAMEGMVRRYDRPFMGQTDAWKFKKLGQMAVFFRLFSPVTPEKMLEIVPKPEKREVVDGAYSAGSVRDREEFKTRMKGVIETLEAVAGEMKSEGNNQAGEVYNAAENLRIQYKILDE